MDRTSKDLLHLESTIEQLRYDLEDIEDKLRKNHNAKHLLSAKESTLEILDKLNKELEQY